MSIQPTDGHQAAAVQSAHGPQPATIHPADAQPASVRPRLAARRM